MLVGRLRDGRVTVSFADIVASGRGAANPMDAVPVSTRACSAGLVLAGLRVVRLWSSGCSSCGDVGAWLSWPPHGRLGVRGFRCAAGGGRIAKCCMCGRHVPVGARQLRLGWPKGGVVRFVSAGWPRP